MATMNQIQAASSVVETATADEQTAQAAAIAINNLVQADVVTELATFEAAQATYEAAVAAASVVHNLQPAIDAYNAAVTARVTAEADLRVLLFEYLGIPDPNA